MASDADVGDDPPPRGEGSPGRDDRSIRSSRTDPPDTPMGSFEGARSFLRRSVMNITSRRRNTSTQDLSGNSILPNESRTFDRGIAAHTVISNQDGSVTELLRQGVFISPESARQQQQKQQQQQQQLSPQRGGDPDGSSYLDLDAVAIANANSIRNGSIGSSSIPSEVNLIQDPPTPPSPAKSSSSSDPEGSVASLNLTNKSTIRKIDNIIVEINEQDVNNNEQNKKEESMSVITGSGGMDWIY